MRITNLVSVIGFLFLLGACSIIKPKDGYDQLANGWKEITVPLSTFEQAKRSEITRINGVQLREELKKHPKAIVRFVVNHCYSNSQLMTVEDFAAANGYRMFIVMYDFRVPYEIFNQPIKDPIFVIDTPYYQTKYVKVSTRGFINDLLHRAPKQKSDLQAYYVFHDGVYIPAAGDLVEKTLKTP